VIEKLERLDNYITYEAEAAQQHFDELMREAAVANGRRKVEMLLAARKPNLESLSGVKRDMKEMSYAYFTDVEQSLAEIYPKIRNDMNKICTNYVNKVWEEHDRDFIAELQNGGGSSGVDTFPGETKPSNDFELKDTSNGEKMHLLKNTSQPSYVEWFY